MNKFWINSINTMNIPLIMKVTKEYKKVYISTGGMSDLHIENLYNNCGLTVDSCILMHSVTAYPAPLSIINMRAITVLKKYSTTVGYSSNDRIKNSAIAAYSQGATIIDKHVHLENTDDALHKASVSINEYAAIIEEVQEFENLLGDEIKPISRGEMINHDILAKSLIINDRSPKNTVLDETNLSVRLPQKGISAHSWFDIIGKTTNKAIEKHEYVFSKDIVELETVGDFDNRAKRTVIKDRSHIPGKIGVVTRFKDIDQIIEGMDIDYVEMHFASSDIGKQGITREYDLDLVVHMPEYAEGKLLDFCSVDNDFRHFSIKVMNQVLREAKALQLFFKRSTGDVKFVLHPGSMTYPVPLKNPHVQYEIFLDSLSKLDTTGIELLIENMRPFPWFLDNDWSPKQGTSNTFLDAHELFNFCNEHNYGVCFDVCHAQLYCTYAGVDLYEYMKTIKPLTRHIHYSDCTGVDGEGIQIGEGDINWRHVCEVFADVHDVGWSPEIWNGHLNSGEAFYQSHELLGAEIKKYNAKVPCVKV